MRLGAIIKQLEICTQDASIYFDFCGLLPDGISSYRGYYDQLAIHWREYDYDKPSPKVSDVLAFCRDAVGKTFTGWKGGEYVMDEATEVWVANPAYSNSTTIEGIYDEDYAVIIKTGYRP